MSIYYRCPDCGYAEPEYRWSETTAKALKTPVRKTRPITSGETYFCPVCGKEIQNPKATFIPDFW